MVRVAQTLLCLASTPKPHLLPPSPGSPVLACTVAQPLCTCPACHTEQPDCSGLQPPGCRRMEVPSFRAPTGKNVGICEGWRGPHSIQFLLTAGWSLPSVFSRIARASLRRCAASLYLFWSLRAGRTFRDVLQAEACPQGPAVPVGTPPEVMTGVQLRAWEAWTALPLRARELGSLSHSTKDSPHTQTPEQHSTLSDPSALAHCHFLPQEPCHPF